MTDGIVARRYAHALFALEKKAGMAALEKAGDNLAALASLLARSAELARFFRNPVFSPGEKRDVLATLGEKLSLSAELRHFCALLADKGRLGALAGIAARYAALLDAEKGVTRGELVTAVPLDEKQRAALLAQLEKKAGGPLALEFKVDPAILGGMRLTIGDKVWDASLMAQLSLLKDTITRGE